MAEIIVGPEAAGLDRLDHRVARNCLESTRRRFNPAVRAVTTSLPRTSWTDTAPGSAPGVISVANVIVRCNPRVHQRIIRASRVGEVSASAAIRTLHGTSAANAMAIGCRSPRMHAVVSPASTCP